MSTVPESFCLQVATGHWPALNSPSRLEFKIWCLSLVLYCLCFLGFLCIESSGGLTRECMEQVSFNQSFIQSLANRISIYCSRYKQKAGFTYNALATSKVQTSLKIHTLWHICGRWWALDNATCVSKNISPCHDPQMIFSIGNSWYIAMTCRADADGTYTILPWSCHDLQVWYHFILPVVIFFIMEACINTGHHL